MMNFPNQMYFPNNMWWIFPVGILDVILKGFALWFAARKSDKIWFIFLIIINSGGILPLIYLIFFAKAPEIEKFKKNLFSAKKK